MRGPEAQLWADHPSATGEESAAELSYAARGLQTEVAQLLARVDGVPDPALHRLAASVRERSDVLSSTRRLWSHEPAHPQRARAAFDLKETVSLAALSLSGRSSGPSSGPSSDGAAMSTRLPDAPVRVMGNAGAAYRAVTRACAILARGGQSPVGATIEVSLSRAGARLDLTVPGVELSAVSLSEVVEAFLGSAAGASTAAGVNVQVVAGRVCIITDPVTATTSVEETTVAAFWELEGSLHDVA